MTPPRVVYPRRLWLLAALAAVLFGLSLLGVEHRDDSWLLKVGGRPLDVRGAAWAAWQDATRDCTRVQRLHPSTAEAIGGPAAQTALPAEATAAAAAVRALRGFSPPDSESARVRRLDHWAPGAAEAMPPKTGAVGPVWWVLQAEFDRLEPVVVLVRQEGPDAHMLAAGVWSGTTLPWNPAWRIRRFLAERVPQAPAALLACIDPLGVFAQPPRPL
ncbi:MAG: hypothetical protein ACKOGB_11945 [Betaproteobacteria bacterium]